MIELHRPLKSAVRIADRHQVVTKAMDIRERVYFGDGEALLHRLLIVGSETGEFDITPAKFAETFLPELATIMAVRDAGRDCRPPP